ncbi:DUF4828 domain-containing protein [Secundilactobacillus oryzae]|nr:DUF4828 domain-containing protein [Secundilactobacillus oryzae]
MKSKNSELASGLFSQLKRRVSRKPHPVKPQHKATEVSPLFYSGVWVYVDELHNRKHLLEVRPDLSIAIDHQPLQVRVKSMTNEKLIFVDKFGYELVLSANDKQPTHLFDEADNQDYLILINEH